MPQHSANIAPTWSQNETRDFQNRAQIEPGGAKKDDDNDNDADDDADDDDNDAADDDDDDCDDDDANKPGMAPGSLQGPIFFAFSKPKPENQIQKFQKTAPGQKAFAVSYKISHFVTFFRLGYGTPYPGSTPSSSGKQFRRSGIFGSAIIFLAARYVQNTILYYRIRFCTTEFCTTE